MSESGDERGTFVACVEPGGVAVNAGDVALGEPGSLELVGEVSGLVELWGRGAAAVAGRHQDSRGWLSA